MTRRLLALAMVLDGHKRDDAAWLADMDRQTLRDWVYCYNAGGALGLAGRHGGWVAPRLSAGQEAEVAGQTWTPTRSSGGGAWTSRRGWPR